MNLTSKPVISHRRQPSMCEAHACSQGWQGTRFFPILGWLLEGEPYPVWASSGNPWGHNKCEKNMKRDSSPAAWCLLWQGTKEILVISGPAREAPCPMHCRCPGRRASPHRLGVGPEDGSRRCMCRNSQAVALALSPSIRYSHLPYCALKTGAGN